jgi:S1-C subfamily serine protease
VQAAVRLAPGNSGGLLANIHGHVIGINAMVMNGLGLAVASEAVQRLLSAAVPFRPGVTVRPARLTDGTQGMLILELDGDGPAATASLFPGDLITGIDTARTPTVEALEAALSTVATERCAKVIIRFRRGGGVNERQATAVAKTHPYTERAA